MISIHKLNFLFLLIIINSYISALAVPKESFAAKKLKDFDACFILLDLKKDKIVERFGGQRCAKRLSPCSTFKIPLAIMGFDSKVLKSESTTFKWDGKAKMLKTWEADQDSYSWMKNSVVWFSQELAKKMGRKNIEKYLKKFNYGNADMSGGLETAWLSPSPNSINQSSVEISADEQVKFFANFWQNKLPVSSQALESTKKITYLETSPKKYTLHGKTGSGFVSKDSNRRIGWFLARIAKDDEEYIGIVSLSDLNEPEPNSGYGGPKAAEIFKAILTDINLW